MRKICLSLLLLALAAPASASYDSSWFQTPYWSGEYPDGISVVKKGTVVLGRKAMDKDVAPSIRCALPYRAVLQPWNRHRNRLSQVTYFTAAKIVPLVAKEDFTFTPDEGAPVALKKGDTVDFLVYDSEGAFEVRIQGKEYTAEQDFFDHMEPVDNSTFVQDEWIRLRCQNGPAAWLLMGDLRKVDASGNIVYLPGLNEVGPGLTGYGEARDLTEREARKLARER
jgi:hypothetical protein